MSVVLYSFPGAGHLAGTVLDIQSKIDQAIVDGRIDIIASQAELLVSIPRFNAKLIDVIAVQDGSYNFAAYQAGSITCIRADGEEGYICPLNAGKVTIGTQTATDNINNQWNFNGCSRVIVAGFYWRRAYRSTSNAHLLKFTGTTLCRVTGNTFDNCGYGLQGCVEVQAPTNFNFRFDHNIITHVNATGNNQTPLRISDWEGQMRISGASAVTRSGTTLTITYNILDVTPLAVGDTFYIGGLNEAEFTDPNEFVVLTSTGSGGTNSTRTITAAIANSGPTVGTYDNDLGYAMIRNVTHRSHKDTRIDHNTWIDSPQANKDHHCMQNLEGRIGTNFSENGGTIIENNFYASNVGPNTQYCNEKGGGTISRYNLIHGPIAFNMRAGFGKHVYCNIAPYSGVEVAVGDAVVEFCVFKNLLISDHGSFDGVSPNGVRDTLFMRTDNVEVLNCTFLDGSYGIGIGKQNGYSGLVPEHRPINITIKNNIIKVTSGPTFTAFNHTLPGYFSQSPAYDIDNNSYDISGTGTSTYAGTNSAVESASFQHQFSLSASSPMLLTGDGDFTGKIDPEGRETVTWRGAIGYTAPNFVYSYNMAGSAGTPMISGTPQTNTTGSSLVTASTSFLLDGNNQAYASQEGDSIGINLGTSVHAPEIEFNAFGANNRARMYVRSNGSKTGGRVIEFSPNEDKIFYYLPTDLVNPIFSFPFPMEGNAWYRLRGNVKNNEIIPYIGDMPLPGIAVPNEAGTWVWFEHGQFVNNAARFRNFKAQSDQQTGSGATEEVITYLNEFNGTNNTLLENQTADIGSQAVAYELSDDATYGSHTEALRVANGLLRPNVDHNNESVMYRAIPSASLTQNSRDGQFEIEFDNMDVNGSSDRCPVEVACRVQDINNMYGFRSVYASGTANRLLQIVKRSTTGGYEVLDTVNYTAMTSLGKMRCKWQGANPTLQLYWTPEATGVEVLVCEATDETNPITTAGQIWYGMGRFFDTSARGDLRFNHRLRKVTYTEIINATVPSTAPKFSPAPSVAGAGFDIVQFLVGTDIDSKISGVMWSSPTAMPNDPTGVGYVVAGQDGSGNVLASNLKYANDTAVGGTVYFPSFDTLSAKPVYRYAFTSRKQSDDTPMVTVNQGIVYMAPAAGKTNTIIPVGAAVSPQSQLYLAFGAIGDNSIVIADELSANGNPVVVDAQGNISCENGGIADSFTIQLWDGPTWDFVGSTLVEIEADSLSWTVDRVIGSGSPPPDGVQVTWTFYPNGVPGSLGGITPIEGASAFSGGVLSGNAGQATAGLFIGKAVGFPWYYIGPVTAA